MLKRVLLDIFELTNSIVMSIPLHFVRRLWMNMLLKEVGEKCVFLRHIRTHTPWRITIGNDVVINRNVMLDGRKGMVIGDSVDIGEYVTIWSLQHDPSDDNHCTCGDKLIIEDHVWIAPRCIILPGVKIGRGAVVATGAVVTKDVAPMTIVGGVPAVRIGELTHGCDFKNNYKVYL